MFQRVLQGRSVEKLYGGTVTRWKQFRLDFGQSTRTQPACGRFTAITTPRRNGQHALSAPLHVRVGASTSLGVRSSGDTTGGQELSC